MFTVYDFVNFVNNGNCQLVCAVMRKRVRPLLVNEIDIPKKSVSTAPLDLTVQNGNMSPAKNRDIFR